MNCPSCRRQVVLQLPPDYCLRRLFFYNNLIQRFSALEAPDQLRADWQSFRQIYAAREVLREQCAGWETARHTRVDVEEPRQWFADLEAVLQWRLNWRYSRQKLDDLGSRLICLSMLETNWGASSESYLQWFGDWDVYRGGALKDSREDFDWEVLQRWRAVLEDLVQRRPDAEDPQIWHKELKDFQQRFKVPLADDSDDEGDDSDNEWDDLQITEWAALRRRFLDWEASRQTPTRVAIRSGQVQALLQRLADWEEVQQKRVLVEDLQKWLNDVKDLAKWRMDWEAMQQDFDADYWRRADREVLQQDWNGYMQWRVGWEVVRAWDGEQSRRDWPTLHRWYTNFANLQQKRPRVQDSQQWHDSVKSLREELAACESETSVIKRSLPER